MKAQERRSKERVLKAWREMLRRLNEAGPVSDSADDLAGFGEVKDYILDRIEVCEQALFSGPKVNRLPPSQNARDNRGVTGAGNG